MIRRYGARSRLASPAAAAKAAEHLAWLAAGGRSASECFSEVNGSRPSGPVNWCDVLDLTLKVAMATESKMPEEGARA